MYISRLYRIDAKAWRQGEILQKRQDFTLIVQAREARYSARALMGKSIPGLIPGHHFVKRLNQSHGLSYIASCEDYRVLLLDPRQLANSL